MRSVSNKAAAAAADGCTKAAYRGKIASWTS
jgi:hypothetical protein